jgi:hypothetical protein
VDDERIFLVHVVVVFVDVFGVQTGQSGQRTTSPEKTLWRSIELGFE